MVYNRLLALEKIAEQLSSYSPPHNHPIPSHDHYQSGMTPASHIDHKPDLDKVPISQFSDNRPKDSEIFTKSRLKLLKDLTSALSVSLGTVRISNPFYSLCR